MTNLYNIFTARHGFTLISAAIDLHVDYRPIEEHWASRIGEAALAIANALPECGHLYIADDMDYNRSAFVDAWNAAHPEEKPITRNIGSADTF